MQASVVLPHGWVYVCSGAEVGEALLWGEGQVTVPLYDFDKDLGMPTLPSVHRQLRVDLPRSLTHVEGVRTVDPERVIRATFYPRLCTQASLAPVVEWIFQAGRIAHEVAQPQVVDVRSDTIHVRKRLGLRTWEGADACTATVTLFVHLGRQTVTVALHRHP